MGIELEHPKKVANSYRAESVGCSRVLRTDRCECPILVMWNGHTLAAGCIRREHDGFPRGPYALFPLRNRP